MFHKSSKTLYHYRIESDSIVHIRKKATAAESAISIPAQTYSWIYRRVKSNVLSPDWAGEYLTVEYEDEYLTLRSSQQFNLYVLGTLILMMIGGGGLILWFWWRLSRERRRREALAQSRRYLAKGREKERERLAQEIHDGPVQDLHGLHMQIQALSNSPEDRLATVGNELMRVTGELRAMSADLHPPALQRFGLAAALRSHADRLRDRHASLQVNLDLADECAPLPDEYALPIFRIAQEAMNNAAQHGNAGHIQVQLQCVQNTLELDVQDDGEGFTPPDDWHTLAEHEHYGLLGMRERAEAIGANLELSSTPGDGTRVRLRVQRSESPTAERPPAPSPSVPA